MAHYSNIYYLCCMNMQCTVSIYNRMVLRVPFNGKYQDAMHRCSYCDKPLVAEENIGITYMMTKVNSQKTKNANNLYN